MTGRVTAVLITHHCVNNKGCILNVCFSDCIIILVPESLQVIHIRGFVLSAMPTPFVTSTL